jgi:hypothetical protein
MEARMSRFARWTSIALIDRVAALGGRSCGSLTLIPDDGTCNISLIAADMSILLVGSRSCIAASYLPQRWGR